MQGNAKCHISLGGLFNTFSVLSRTAASMKKRQRNSNARCCHCCASWQKKKFSSQTTVALCRCVSGEYLQAHLPSAHSNRLLLIPAPLLHFTHAHRTTQRSDLSIQMAHHSRWNNYLRKWWSSQIICLASPKTKVSDFPCPLSSHTLYIRLQLFNCGYGNRMANKSIKKIYNLW